MASTHASAGGTGRWNELLTAMRARGSSVLLLGIFALLVLILLVSTPAFGNVGNISNVLQQNSIIGIVACGMLLMIILGGFDLSVGAVGAMSSVVAAVLIVHVNTTVGIVVALLAGLGVGLLNGFFIAGLGMSPFVVTLGTQTVVNGALYVATKAKPVYGVPPEFTKLGLGKIGPVPIALLFFVGTVLLVWILLRFSRFGHHIYAVGGNPAAARLAGINVPFVIVVTYGIGALLAALAGIILLGQTGIGQPNSATTWPLSAIAAVVVGGVPLSGGSGKVGWAVLGTLLLGVIANALNLTGVSAYWQPVVSGLVILGAVGIDSYQRKRRAQR
ncbi:ABC transporter permease [Kineosporia succinea]|uniref:Ribose transport system permease protein/putative xylitol transport system permease protein n=1 Tax=Kineosporia succinea TaxID=84632 RepID=A0ABT9PCM8_9ACTN|nr:ABC transporter permease [Kineosporia succinea]MDP9830237.1 ribose transport system permease protein/putative xylitol transport system permease protein [Kineosporia succinea]